MMSINALMTTIDGHGIKIDETQIKYSKFIITYIADSDNKVVENQEFLNTEMTFIDLS
jgi:hypothetical protein